MMRNNKKSFLNKTLILLTNFSVVISVHAMQKKPAASEIWAIFRPPAMPTLAEKKYKTNEPAAAATTTEHLDPLAAASAPPPQELGLSLDDLAEAGEGLLLMQQYPQPYLQLTNLAKARSGIKQISKDLDQHLQQAKDSQQLETILATLKAKHVDITPPAVSWVSLIQYSFLTIIYHKNFALTQFFLKHYCKNVDPDQYLSKLIANTLTPTVALYNYLKDSNNNIYAMLNPALHINILVILGVDLNQVAAQHNFFNLFGGSNSAHLPLWYAIQSGDLTILQTLLANGANPNMLDNDQNSMLLFALINDNYQACELLLKSGAEPNSAGKDKKLPTLLAYAIQRNNLPALKLLLQYGANPNQSNGDTIPPSLIYAIQHKNLPIVTLLLTGTPPEKQAEAEHKADPLVFGPDGISAVTTAIIQQQPAIVELLLQFGANPYVMDRQQKLALAYAIEYHDAGAEENGRTQAFTILLKYRAPIDLMHIDQSGNSLLHYAMIFKQWQLIPELTQQVNDRQCLAVQLTHKNKEDKNCIDYTVRHAIDSGDLEPLSQVLKVNTLNLKTTNKEQQALLCQLIAYKPKDAENSSLVKRKLEVMRLLLKYDNSLIDWRIDGAHDTPLSLAVRSGEVELAAYLIKQGADLTVTVNDQSTWEVVGQLIGAVADIAIDYGDTKARVDRACPPLAAAAAGTQEYLKHKETRNRIWDEIQDAKFNERRLQTDNREPAASTNKNLLDLCLQYTPTARSVEMQQLLQQHGFKLPEKPCAIS